MATAAEMATKVRFSEERTNICFLPFGLRVVRAAWPTLTQGLCQSRKSVIQALRPPSKGREYPKFGEIFPCRGERLRVAANVRNGWRADISLVCCRSSVRMVTERRLKPVHPQPLAAAGPSLVERRVPRRGLKSLLRYHGMNLGKLFLRAFKARKAALCRSLSFSMLTAVFRHFLNISFLSTAHKPRMKLAMNRLVRGLESGSKRQAQRHPTLARIAADRRRTCAGGAL